MNINACIRRRRAEATATPNTLYIIAGSQGARVPGCHGAKHDAVGLRARTGDLAEQPPRILTCVGLGLDQQTAYGCVG